VYGFTRLGAREKAQLNSATGSRASRKVRELIIDLEAAGFVSRGGKWNHRNFVHPRVSKPITVSGNTGDAKPYQERAVRAVIE
jgi:predicted RNA binding protein YcfA (HicA-like mRNA interferase family)